MTDTLGVLVSNVSLLVDAFPVAVAMLETEVDASVLLVSTVVVLVVVVVTLPVSTVLPEWSLDGPVSNVPLLFWPDDLAG